MGKVKKADLRFAVEGSTSDLKQAIANHNPLDPRTGDVLYITTYNTAQHRFIDLVIVMTETGKKIRVTKNRTPESLAEAGLSEEQLKDILKRLDEPSDDFTFTFVNFLVPVKINFIVCDESHHIAGLLSKAHGFCLTMRAKRLLAASALPFSGMMRDLTGFLNLLVKKGAKQHFRPHDSNAFDDAKKAIKNRPFWDNQDDDTVAKVARILDPKAYLEQMKAGGLDPTVTCTILPPILQTILLFDCQEQLVTQCQHESS